MTIKIWSSYSCNNSSSYRLVAKFADAETAEVVAAEVEKFLSAHAHEVDGRGDYSEDLSTVQLAIGTKYGFTWGDGLNWGGGEMIGDEPDLFVENEVLIVQHTYCSGLGDLPLLLEKLGASDIDDDDGRTVNVSILFRAVAGTDPTLDSELATMFAQLEGDEPRVSPLRAPWAMDESSYGNVAWFRDAGTVGLYVPLDPRDLANLKTWLAERAIENPVIRICEPADFHAFWAIAKARCTACQGSLDYLDPRLHDIEAPQLVCRACGGLYELSTFVPSKP